MNIRHQLPLARLHVCGAIASMALLSGCLSGTDSADDGGQPPAPPINSPPTISGNPPLAVTINEAYSFTPTASDPDGDTLTFSIANQPTWADFDEATGRLWGTPTLGDIGIAANVRISVSDGRTNSSLSAFDVSVTQAALGSATLTWTAPTQNTDGTTVTDLAGYRVYYGTAMNQWSNQINIDNPSVTTYVVENLSPDTYYFVATAINASGAESAYSNATTRTIQ